MRSGRAVRSHRALWGSRWVPAIRSRRYRLTAGILRGSVLQTRKEITSLGGCTVRHGRVYVSEWRYLVHLATAGDQKQEA